MATWSPADSLVERNDELAWVDVHKTVIKRRFCVDGDECVSAEGVALATADGVDVEVVAVTVEGVEAWSFAFVAFGPTASRRSAIVSASKALFADKGVPELGLLSGRSGGYPNWLVHVASPRPTSQNPWRPTLAPVTARVCRGESLPPYRGRPMVRGRDLRQDQWCVVLPVSAVASARMSP